MKLHLLLPVLLVRAATALATPVELAGTDVNGHPLDLTKLRDQVVVVDIASRYTEAEATHVNQALAPLVRPGRVVVVSVVDMMGIPDTMFEYVQKRVIDSSLGSPIVYLVDLAGQWRAALALDPSRHVGMVVIDRRGEVRGRYASDEELPALMHLVAQLRPPPKSPHK